MKHLELNPLEEHTYETSVPWGVIIPSKQGTLTLLERCFLWLLSKRRNHFESKGLECVQCPLCGAANRNIGRPLRPATYLGRVRLPVKEHIAPIENAVDKDMSV